MKSLGLFWKNKESDDIVCPNREKCDRVGSSTHVHEKFEVHLNLWNTEVIDNVTRKNEKLYALDFGVVCPIGISELVLLLPFKITDGDFFDLASRLANDKDLLCTVFNDNLIISSKPSNSYHKIENENKSLSLILYELSTENIVDLKYYPNNGYTVLKIVNNLEQGTFDKGAKLYVRFRIRLKDMSVFAIQRQVSNDWFQSAFSSCYMFDIRLNDVRELDKKVKEKLFHDGYQMAKLEKVHFFYMADADESVENGSAMMLDSRLLETQRWHSYFGSNTELKKENLAHHWKKYHVQKIKDGNNVNEKGDIVPFDDFCLFFKVVYTHYKLDRVLWYCFIVLLLGFIASAIVSFLQSLCEFAQIEWIWAFWLTIIIVVSSIFVLCLKYRCRMN